jgi:hypothetical protein
MTASSAESIGASSTATPQQLFVINLAASTSPMALSHPSSPELKRYTFFVSRQREEGRERFRLHMGYFATQEEAEALLPTVRDIYPAAWAGPAPTTGMGRRGRITPANVVAVKPAPQPAVSPYPSPSAALAQASAASLAAPAAAVPPAAASAPAAAAPKTTPRPAAAAAPASGVAAPAQGAKVATPPAVRPASAAASAPQPAAKAPAAARPAASAAPLDAMSNVRDVLAQLSESNDDNDSTVRMRVLDPPAAQPAAAAKSPSTSSELSPTDTLSLLESPAPQMRAPPAPELPPLKNPFEGLENEPEVRLITPEDTQTLDDIRIDRQNNAPPCYAVQLVWSVSPIDVSSLPHLAIFDAYTLYNVEGNRQGRKWYGLRLGFFSDPNSATQVANYVRSDYRSVAVVPVSQKERDRAKGGGRTATPPADVPQKTTEKELVAEEMKGFELLADDGLPPKRDLDDARRTANGAAPAAAGKGKGSAAAAPRLDAPPGTPKGRPAGKRVVVRRRPPPIPAGKTVSAGVAGPEVLESTLEILGASTLSLEEQGRAIINDAAARKPEAKKSSGRSRFSRLLSRLAGG